MASAVSGSRTYSAFLLLGLCVLCVYSFERGQGDHLEMFGAPYFVIGYDDGFIKRGLVGQIFLSAFGRGHSEQIWGAAQFVHRLVAFSVLVGLITWLWSSIRDCRGLAADRLVAFFCVFASGQFLPTLAATAGYLDVYVFALILIGYRAVGSGCFILAAAVGLIGPIVHEMFVFYWLPVTIILLWWHAGVNGFAWQQGAAAGSAFVSTVAVDLFSSTPAAALQLQRAPLTPGIRAAMLSDQFGQTVQHSVARMMQLYYEYPLRFVCTFAAFMLPMAGMLLLVPRQRGLRRHSSSKFIAAAVAPLTVLLFAWDLSRMVVAAQYTTALCGLLLWQRDPAFWKSEQFANGERATAYSAVAVLLAFPLIYGYFDKVIVVGNSVLDKVPHFGLLLHTLY